jgi:chaperonin GroEL
MDFIMETNEDLLNKPTNEPIILSNKELILRGINYLADNVKVTLGAKGKTVMYLDKKSNKPRITKDGVTVCRYTHSYNEIENMAIDIMREASEKTVKSAGDGTTTTIIIAQYLINKGIELMKNGLSYYDLALLMDNVKSIINDYVIANSISIESNTERLLDVATVSSNNKEIGEFIYNIIKEISIYGAIEIKNSNATKDRIEMVKGLKVSKGYYAPHFVNDLVKMQWKHKEVCIVLYDDTVRAFADVIPYINEVEGRPILFIVNEVEPTVLQTMITAKITNPSKLNIMFIEHDGFGDRRTEIMNDIAAMTGATRASNDVAGTIGFANEVIVDEWNTSILGGDMVKGLVDELIIETNEKMNNLEIEEMDKRYYKRRLANLKGGVAVIYVGGITEVEMKEKKDRIEDAVEAVKAAIDRGVSIGGGYTFIKCYQDIIDRNLCNENELIIIKSILEPFNQLCYNADIPIDSTMEHIINENKGYDLISNKFYDIDDYKIYDPTGVLIDSLNNAIAVSKSILSIEKCLIERLDMNDSFSKMINER